jgi:hypothetical protein
MSKRVLRSTVTLANGGLSPLQSAWLISHCDQGAPPKKVTATAAGPGSFSVATA